MAWNSLICYFTNGIYCFVYNLEKNKFNNTTKIFDGGNGESSFKMGLSYIPDEKVFVVSLITASSELKFIKFTENYKIKESNSEGKCYSSFYLP